MHTPLAVLALLITTLGAVSPLSLGTQQEEEVRCLISGILLDQETSRPIAGGVNWVASRRAPLGLNGVEEVGDAGVFILEVPCGPVALVGWARGSGGTSYGRTFTFLMARPDSPAEIELVLPRAAIHAQARARGRKPGCSISKE